MQTKKSAIYSFRASIAVGTIAVVGTFVFLALTIRSKRNKYQLVDSIKTGNISALKSFLRDGFDPNETLFEYNEKKALHIACQHGRVKIVDILLANGASPDVQDNIGYTPLHYTIGFNRGSRQIDIMKLLHQAGAQINKPTYEYYGNSTPLHKAAQRSDYEAVLRLIQWGGNVNARNSNGWTPLHSACGTIVANKFDPRVVEVLVKNGADPTLISNDGRTPLQMIPCDRRSTDEIAQVIKILGSVPPMGEDEDK